MREVEAGVIGWVGAESIDVVNGSAGTASRYRSRCLGCGERAELSRHQTKPNHPSDR
jgi:hypothetical protein